MKQQGCTRGARRALAWRREGRYLVVVLAVLTAACSGLRADSPTEEKVKVVAERSAARWKAIIGKDFATAYDYMSPATRSTITPAGFKTVASRIAYRNAEVKEVTCDVETCRVKLIITYDAKIMAGVHTPLEESWIIEKGQAWYVWPL